MQGVNTIHQGRRWNALLAMAAVVLIAGLVALLVLVVPPATNGNETERAIPGAGAGSAVIHDDAGSVNHGPILGSAIIHDDAGNVNATAGAGSAIIHDDAGNISAGAGSAIIHDDAGNVNR